MADDWKSRATSALELGMASDLAQAYFNDPVDPEALGIPEYYEVIKTPMDLGTCKAKLMRGDYVKAQELLRDVQLVWSNCRLFNTPESDVVEACETVEEEFKKLWRQHGLVDAKPSSVVPAVPEESEEEEEEEESGEEEEGDHDKVPATPDKSGKSEKKGKKDKTGKSRGKRPRKPTLPMCLKLLKQLTKTPDAEPFLVPVDAEELGLDDYHERVQNPMDLGTILEVLQSGKIVGWANIKYKSPLDFRKDVQLVWDNCRLYNDQPEDLWIREMCDRCEENFNRLWREQNFQAYYEYQSVSRGGETEGEEGDKEGADGKNQKSKKSKSKDRAGRKKSEKKAKKAKLAGIDDDLALEPMTPDKMKRKREDMDYFPDLDSDFTMTPTPLKIKKPSKSASKSSKKATQPATEDKDYVPLTDEQVREVFNLKPQARCPVCKVQKKGSCGTITSPMRCYRRQYNNLPFTPLTYEDMHKFANMITNRAKNRSSKAPKRTKEEIMRQKLATQVQRKQQEAKKAKERAEGATAQALDLENIVKAMEAKEREIKEKEQKLNDEREEKATFVDPADYQVPVVTIPDHIMSLGNYFFAKIV